MFAKTENIKTREEFEEVYQAAKDKLKLKYKTQTAIATLASSFDNWRNSTDKLAHALYLSYLRELFALKKKASLVAKHNNIPPKRYKCRHEFAITRPRTSGRFISLEHHAQETTKEGSYFFKTEIPSAALVPIPAGLSISRNKKNKKIVVLQGKELAVRGKRGRPRIRSKDVKVPNFDAVLKLVLAEAATAAALKPKSTPTDYQAEVSKKAKLVGNEFFRHPKIDKNCGKPKKPDQKPFDADAFLPDYASDKAFFLALECSEPVNEGLKPAESGLDERILETFWNQESPSQLGRSRHGVFSAQITGLEATRYDQDLIIGSFFK